MKRIIFILLFSFIFTSFYTRKQETKQVNIKENISFLSNKELNDSILYLALTYYKVKYPKIVLAQAKLESGNYTSNHYKNKNNFLGLYNSRKQEYFKFNHWHECILAYKNMVEYKIKDKEDYYDFLIRVKYAADPNYIHKVKRIENSLEI